MKYNIRPYWWSYEEPILFTINLKNKDFLKYYNEVSKRLCNIPKENQEEYFENNYCCDIDEVSMWDMSINTLQDYIKFITK
jgi:cytidylate kinase